MPPTPKTVTMTSDRAGSQAESIVFERAVSCRSERWGHGRRGGFVGLMVILVGLGGCGGPAETPGDGGGPGARSPRALGAVLPMFSHPFFVAQKNGLEEEARARGITIDVRDGQDNDQKQINQVEALISLSPAAIILCPRDENALIPAVESANRAGIPVVTMNRRVNGGTVVTYVGADDADGGRAQAQTLVEALGTEGGQVIYLQGTPGSSPQVSREKGFKEVLAQHPEITLAADQYTDFQEDTAKEVMSGLALRFQPGEIRAIVAQADELALPAAEVAAANGWRDVVVIGFNGTREAFDAIRAGRMHATILQDAAAQGRLAVEAAARFLDGESLPTEMFTELPVIKASNVDDHHPAY